MEAKKQSQLSDATYQRLESLRKGVTQCISKARRARQRSDVKRFHGVLKLYSKWLRSGSHARHEALMIEGLLTGSIEYWHAKAKPSNVREGELP